MRVRLSVRTMTEVDGSFATAPLSMSYNSTWSHVLPFTTAAPSSRMLMMNCLGGADSGRNDEVVCGNCTLSSFSICANVVAHMKKISRLKTMSVSGTRLYGSSPSVIGSLILMAAAFREWKQRHFAELAP